jgi:hypothetical protein
MKTEELKEGKAKRILKDGLSKKEISWDVPADLKNNINQDNYFKTFVSLGRWKNNVKKFILISQQGVLIYLEKDIVKKLWDAVKF